MALCAESNPTPRAAEKSPGLALEPTGTPPPARTDRGSTTEPWGLTPRRSPYTAHSVWGMSLSYQGAQPESLRQHKAHTAPSTQAQGSLGMPGGSPTVPRQNRSQQAWSVWASPHHAPGHTRGQDQYCQSQPGPLHTGSHLQTRSGNQKGSEDQGWIHLISLVWLR